MEQIKELHRHLFGEEMCFDDQHCHKPIDDRYFLMRRKNRCSHEIQKDDHLSKNEFLKNKYSKKNAAKKQTKKCLAFEKSKRIFGVFYILTLTNIKGAFFSLNRVPKNRAKGTKKSGIEANSSLNPLKVVYFIKMIGAYFEAKLMKNSKMSRFNCLQKGTKKSGMRLNEAKNRAKGTKKSGKGTTFGGKGTKIQGMRLNEAEIWARGTKKSGKGTTFGGESKKIPQKVCATHARSLSSNSHPLARFSEDQILRRRIKNHNAFRQSSKAKWHSKLALLSWFLQRFFFFIFFGRNMFGGSNMKKSRVNETNERRKSHCPLFPSGKQFGDEFLESVVKKQNCLNDRKNRCSHEIQKDDQLSKNVFLKNKYFKKNAAKKQTKKSLTFEKRKRIFDVFLYYLNYLRERFLASTGYQDPGEKVPRSGGKVPRSGGKVPRSGEKVPRSGEKVPLLGGVS